MPEVEFAGGTIPPFSLKIPLTSKQVKSIDQMDEINAGLFRSAGDDNVKLVDEPLIAKIYEIEKWAVDILCYSE